MNISHSLFVLSSVADNNKLARAVFNREYMVTVFSTNMQPYFLNMNARPCILLSLLHNTQSLSISNVLYKLSATFETTYCVGL